MLLLEDCGIGDFLFPCDEIVVLGCGRNIEGMTVFLAGFGDGLVGGGKVVDVKCCDRIREDVLDGVGVGDGNVMLVVSCKGNNGVVAVVVVVVGVRVDVSAGNVDDCNDGDVHIFVGVGVGTGIVGASDIRTGNGKVGVVLVGVGVVGVGVDVSAGNVGDCNGDVHIYVG